VTAPYREHARPRVVIHGRIRLSAPLLGLFMLFAIGAPMFALRTDTMVSMTCARLSEKNIECTVYGPGASARGVRGFLVVEPIEVRVEPKRLVAANATGDDVLLDGDYSDDDLRKLGAVLERVHTRRLPRDEASVGGAALERRILVPGLLVAVVQLLISFRRRRVVIDPNAETIVASTMLGVLPMARRRAVIARESSISYERTDEGRRVIVDGRRGKVTLFEGTDDELETLAKRVNAALAEVTGESPGS